MSKNPATHYTEKNTRTELGKELEKPQTLYKATCVNWKGSAYDTRTFHTEIIAKELLEEKNLDGLLKLELPKRENGSYYTKGHNGKIENYTNRIEEIIAKKLFQECQDDKEIAGIGHIFDYQVPLKNQKANKEDNNGVGKIDLVSIDKGNIRIIELKAPKAEDTLLRCILEAYTYSKQISQEKFINDFNKAEFNLPKFVNNEEPVFIPTVLIPEGCNASTEIDNHPNVQELANKLNVDIKRFQINIDIKLI